MFRLPFLQTIEPFLDRIFQWTVTFLPTCCVGDPLECSVFRFFKPSSHFWISRLEQTLAQRYLLRLLCLLKHVWNEPRLPFTLRSQSRKVLGLRSSIFLEDCTCPRSSPACRPGRAAPPSPEIHLYGRSSPERLLPLLPPLHSSP